MSQLNDASKKVLALELFEAELTKSQRTRLKIIEAAIKVFSSKGIESTTIDAIARRAKVNRRVISLYFENIDGLLLVTAKYIRGNFQRIAVEAIEKAKDPVSLLDAYVSSTFDWVESYPEHIKVWILILYYAGVEDPFRQLNSGLVATGHERIISLLVDGQSRGFFRCKDARWTAKMIQTVITGALISAITEDLPWSLRVYKAKIVEECHQLAKSSTVKI